MTTLRWLYTFKIDAELKAKSNNESICSLEPVKVAGKYQYDYLGFDKKCPNIEKIVRKSSGPIEPGPNNPGTLSLHFNKKKVNNSLGFLGELQQYGIDIPQLEGIDISKLQEIMDKMDKVGFPFYKPSTFALVLLAPRDVVYFQENGCSCNCCKSASRAHPCTPTYQQGTSPGGALQLEIVAPLSELSAQKSWSVPEDDSFIELIRYWDEGENTQTNIFWNPPSPENRTDCKISLHWKIRKMGPGGI